MGILAIRDDLLRRVAKLAESRQSSIELEAEEMLLESLRRREAALNVRRTVDSIAAMTPPHSAQTDSVDLLREDRAR
jgi:uncharacterized protein HemY